jgi:hypothetical protein
MTPTLSVTIAALSKLPYARCAVISAAMTAPLIKTNSYKPCQPGPVEILVGPVETEFQGRLGSSYDAGPGLYPLFLEKRKREREEREREVSLSLSVCVCVCVCVCEREREREVYGS